MSTEQTADLVIALAVLLALAHSLGQVFARFRQPKLIGEILAGVLVGPFVLGHWFPEACAALLGGTEPAGQATRHALGFLYSLGLLLLMFLAGSEARRVLAKENLRATIIVLTVGTTLPFCAILLLGSSLPMDLLAGERGRGTPVLLVLAIAVAVTSIPVISRIFSDLKILHTRFASLVIGIALLQDLALWAVLAVAAALGNAAAGGPASGVSGHIITTVVFMIAGLFLAPPLLKRLHSAPWNLIRESSPTGYATLILLTYAGLAAVLDVNLVFAAFLGGFGLVGGMSGSERPQFQEPLDAIQKVAAGVFIPIYFALVGSHLVLGEGFDPVMLIAFLLGSSLLSLVSTGIAAKLAGLRGIEIANLAITCNARGGPGIVMASVAYEAGLIAAPFFTCLVITAVLTSQFAGVWLLWVLRTGRPLLGEPEQVAA
ncbi:MAG TPA: cation:proton antiporter [Planctomycetota bacterium]|nr:cation:proton antiporter [Planctomycetota bacterium]